MHKNTDFHIEQTRLNDTYRKLNSGNDFSSYIYEQENQSPTYWSFLKLRIGFSILLFYIGGEIWWCILKQNHSEIQYQTDFNVQEVNENVEIKNDSIA